MRAAVFVLFAAFLVGYLPSRIDTARRNRRARLARNQAAAECHANYWRDSEAWEAWKDETPIQDALVCEQLKSQFNGGAS
jgi:hypothetical protein